MARRSRVTFKSKKGRTSFLAKRKKNPIIIKLVYPRCPNDGKPLFEMNCKECKHSGDIEISDYKDKPFKFVAECYYVKTKKVTSK